MTTQSVNLSSPNPNIKISTKTPSLVKEDKEHLDGKGDVINEPVDIDDAGDHELRGFFENRYVVFVALFASMAGLLFGYDQGVISVTLVMDHFAARFPRIDDTQNSTASFWRGLMTAMIEFGAMLGALQAGFTAEKWGRKMAIMVGCCFFIVGSAVQTGSVGYGMLIIGRLIGGIGIGTLSMVAPMYVSEIAPVKIRGALLVLEEWNIVFGVVVAFWFTYGTRFWNSEGSFRLPFGIQILPGIVLLFGAAILPQSPRWQASHSPSAKTLATLCRLRRLPPTDPRVQKEFLDIQVEADFMKRVREVRHPGLVGMEGRGVWWEMKQEVVMWGDLFRKGCLKRTVTGVGLMFFQQFVGINALIYYSPTLFKTLGLSYNSRLTWSGVMNVMQLVGVFFSFFLLDKVGRRPLLLAGSIGMTVCHVIVAALIGQYNNDWPSHPDAGWAGVSLILIYMVTFGVSWGPVPWAIPAEIFPSSLRSKGVAISTVSNWFNNFIIGLITPPLIANTHEGAFIFFAIFSFLSFFFVWFYVPETAHRTLEEMDSVFGDNAGAEEATYLTEITERIKHEGTAATVHTEKDMA